MKETAQNSCFVILCNKVERNLVAANRGLITRFAQKTQATLARTWGGEAKAAEPVTSP